MSWAKHPVAASQHVAKRTKRDFVMIPLCRTRVHLADGLHFAPKKIAAV